MNSNRFFIFSIYIFIIFLLIFALGACTNSRIPSQATMHVDHLNIQHRQNIANQLFKQHDYYESLIQWKILHSIQPDNPKYKNRIRVLNALINRRLKTHLNSADAALRKNNLRTAELEFLKVLALNPNHAEAIKAVKRIEANRAVALQTQKTQKLLQKQQVAQNNQENNLDTNGDDSIDDNGDIKVNEQAALYLEMGIDLFNKKDWRGSIRETSKYLHANPSDPKAISIITTAHLNLSHRFEQRGHLEPAIQHMEDLVSINKNNKKKYSEKLLHLRQKLSASYYIEGVKVYRDNINQAINYWKRAVETNPENEKAMLRLRKAEKMQQKLKTINPE